MPSLREKILGILLYMIPWANSLSFGNHLKYPFIELIKIPAIPIIIIEKAMYPFGTLLLFLAIFFGIIRNNKVSYFLRFNALQSLLVNICIILISFVFQIFFNPFGNSLIFRTFSSTLLLSLVSILTYCVWSCIQGNEPNLPGISQATKMQL